MGTSPTITMELRSILLAAERITSDLHLGVLKENIARAYRELAGASSSVLVLPRDGQWYVEALAPSSTPHHSIARPLPARQYGLPLPAIERAAAAREIALAQEGGADQATPAWMCVPIAKNSSVLAVVYLERAEGANGFDPQRIALIEALHGTVANALDNALANAEVHHWLNDLRHSKARLEFDAYHDPLTGLRNRTWLIHYLERMTAQFERRQHKPELAVLSIDLDRFKFVNDSLGHEVGDMLLCSVAECIQQIVPADAITVRYGGDEFVVLVEGMASLPAVRAMAEQITARLRRPFALGSYVIYSSARIGIACSSAEHPSPEHILKNADMALMRAKVRNNGGIQVFDPAMRQELHNEARLEYELRQALTHPTQAFRDLYLHYQPIISMASGHLIGYEALVRWRHPELGQIPPDRFVVLAEEVGLIETLSWWILSQACRQLRQWRSLPGGEQLVMQVNISPILLMQVHFAERVAAVLRDTGVPGGALKLEITESSTLDVEEVGLQSLEKLRLLGVCLCIDDFGTGYSSLSRLRELPIATIKIDRVFISRMSSLNDGLAIVEMILALGETLKMDIVAEGVETNEQWQLLRAIGCVLGQGFLFSLPLDAERAGELVGKRLTLEDRQFAWASFEPA